MQNSRILFYLLISTLFLVIFTQTTSNTAQARIESMPIPPPIPGQTVTIALVGDFGDESQAEQDVADLIDSWSPDYVVTVGDNRYGTSDLDAAVGQYYCDYMNGATPGTHCPTGGNAAINRFYPTVGNHDYSDGNGIIDYLNYFDIPGAGSISSNTSGTELYYDFLLGPVHFFSLNSETFVGDTSTQATWAQSEMQISPAPWQIVLLHRSTYTSVDRGNRGGHMRWPYEAWGADIVINGDDHFYERLSIGDLNYLVNGAGGAPLYGFGPIDPASNLRYAADYGALRLVATDTSLAFEYYDRTGALQDSLSLPQTFPDCRTISLPASDDTWLDSGNPTTNNVNDTLLYFDGDPDDTGVLMRWDFSSLPSGAMLQSAPILTLDFVDQSVNSYEIYEMTQTWDASSATWNHYDGTNSWPGGAGAFGDRGAQIGATAGDNALKNNITFNTAGQTLVQNWIDGTTANNGLLIADYSGATDGGDIYYHSHLTLDYCATPTALQLISAESNLKTLVLEYWLF